MARNGKGRGRDPLPHNEAVIDCYRAAHQRIRNTATGGHSDLEELHQAALTEFTQRLTSNDPRYVSYGVYRSTLLDNYYENADAKILRKVFGHHHHHVRRAYARATEEIQELQIGNLSKNKAQEEIGKLLCHLYDDLIKLPAPLDSATGKPKVNPDTGKPRMWGALLGDLSMGELARMVSYRQVLSKEDQIALNLMGVTLSKANALGANSTAKLRVFFAA
ncbi:MAG: hypothetical protein M3R38_07110 [Actinomycetota bacterium]|nr:hypothetical protein [Actinomycetota bacterium]